MNYLILVLTLFLSISTYANWEEGKTFDLSSMCPKESQVMNLSEISNLVLERIGMVFALHCFDKDEIRQDYSSIGKSAADYYLLKGDHGNPNNYTVAGLLSHTSPEAAMISGHLTLGDKPIRDKGYVLTDRMFYLKFVGESDDKKELVHEIYTIELGTESSGNAWIPNHVFKHVGLGVTVKLPKGSFYPEIKSGYFDQVNNIWFKMMKVEKFEYSDNELKATLSNSHTFEDEAGKYYKLVFRAKLVMNLKSHETQVVDLTVSKEN